MAAGPYVHGRSFHCSWGNCAWAGAEGRSVSVLPRGAKGRAGSCLWDWDTFTPWLGKEPWERVHASPVKEAIGEHRFIPHPQAMPMAGTISCPRAEAPLLWLLVALRAPIGVERWDISVSNKITQSQIHHLCFVIQAECSVILWDYDSYEQHLMRKKPTNHIRKPVFFLMMNGTPLIGIIHLKSEQMTMATLQHPQILEVFSLLPSIRDNLFPGIFHQHFQLNWDFLFDLKTP